MLIRILKRVNKYLPENLKLSFIPYYRRFFPTLSHIVFVPQLNCNYSCPYCIWNRFTPQKLKDSYHPYLDWIAVFQNLPASAVIITGGEPFLYKDIVPLIENFPQKHLISQVVTNLSVNIEKLISLRKKEFRIMTSFHPSMVSREEFKDKLILLKKNGFNNVTVNFVAYPEYLKDVPFLKEYFEKSTGFYFRVDTFKDPDYTYSQEELQIIREFKKKGIIAKDRTEVYDFGDFSHKVCKGGRKYLIIVANGNVYSCMEGYYYSECPPYKDKYNKIDTFCLGNVFEGDFRLSDKDKICHSPCAEPCDIELAGVRKTKRP